MTARQLITRLMDITDLDMEILMVDDEVGVCELQDIEVKQAHNHTKNEVSNVLVLDGKPINADVY